MPSITFHTPPKSIPTNNTVDKIKYNSKTKANKKARQQDI